MEHIICMWHFFREDPSLPESRESMSALPGIFKPAPAIEERPEDGATSGRVGLFGDRA